MAKKKTPAQHFAGAAEGGRRIREVTTRSQQGLRAAD